MSFTVLRSFRQWPTRQAAVTVLRSRAGALDRQSDLIPVQHVSAQEVTVHLRWLFEQDWVERGSVSQTSKTPHLAGTRQSRSAQLRGVGRARS